MLGQVALEAIVTNCAQPYARRVTEQAEGEGLWEVIDDGQSRSPRAVASEFTSPPDPINGPR